MPQHTSLASLFQDIANAIREKDGTTAGIVADTFPSRVRDLHLGTVTQVPTEAQMDSYLTPANAGRAYEYTGPNGKYMRGFIYIVDES